MRSRPVIRAGRASLRSRPAKRSLAGRIRQLLVRILLVALLAPPVLLLAYRFLPPPTWRSFVSTFRRR